MKKKYITAIFLGLTVIFSSCGRKVPSENTITTTEVTTEATSETTTDTTTDTTESVSSDTAVFTEDTSSQPALNLDEIISRLYGDAADVQTVCISEEDASYMLIPEPKYGSFGCPLPSAIYLVNCNRDLCQNLSDFLSPEIKTQITDNGNLLSLSKGTDGAYYAVYASYNMDGDRRLLYPKCIRFEILPDANAEQGFTVSASVCEYISPLEDDLYITGWGMGIDGCISGYGEALSNCICDMQSVTGSKDSVCIGFDAATAQEFLGYYASADWCFDETAHTFTAMVPCTPETEIGNIAVSASDDGIVKKITLTKPAENCIAISINLDEDAAYYSLNGDGTEETVEIRFYKNTENGYAISDSGVILTDGRESVRPYVSALQSDGYITGQALSEYPRSIDYPQF